MFSKNQRGLANLMSASVSKWAVCPISSGANLQDLDANLEVEDAAFQDFQKEGYRKWTGFEAEIPGEKCDGAHKVLPNAVGFENGGVCAINELHANHVERFTRD